MSSPAMRTTSLSMPEVAHEESRDKIDVSPGDWPALRRIPTTDGGFPFGPEPVGSSSMSGVGIRSRPTCVRPAPQVRSSPGSSPRIRTRFTICRDKVVHRTSEPDRR